MIISSDWGTPTLIIIVDTEAIFVKVTSIAVLRVPCMDQLDVLGGFFVSGKRHRLIGACGSLSVAGHDAMVESVQKKRDSKIGAAVLGTNRG